MSQQLKKSNYKILIVDDVPNNLRLLSTALTSQGYQIRCAKSGKMALMSVRNDLPHLILLDISMPELSGYQVCQQLKSDPLTRSIPIIFLSAQDNSRDRAKAFTIGGMDFIGKPFQIEEVLARVQNQLTLQAANAQIKTLNEELEQRVKQRTAELASANSVLKQEILQHHQLEQRLRHDALHDSLTKLPNRNLFMQAISKCLDNASDNLEQQFAILFIDLDRFKIINDSLGNLAGDKLLIACAQRLENCLDESTILARLGGDEFTILIEKVNDVQDAVTIAEKILSEFALPFRLGSRSLTITVSIGIVLGNSEYSQEIDLLRDADTALYRAKELGKARYEIFDRQMYLDAMRRLELENELRQAIFQPELVLYYQPIFSLDTRRLLGFEALVRWIHPDGGIIPPGEFIPLAEETSLIVPLGEWVMSEACKQLKVWQDNLPQAKSLLLSINVAGEQLRDRDFLHLVDRIIAQTQVNPNCLKFEITESMLIEDTKQAIAVLEKIKDRNIKLSIDDFGTGYSSLSYLPQFPVDVLKIDQSFVNAMNVERQNLEVVKAIVTLAQVLNMQIIAEGIETEEQLNTLKSLGVEYGQGFLMSQPLTLELATELIANC